MQLVFTQFRWIPAVTRIHGGEKKNCQNIIRNVSKHSWCKESASPKSICSRSMFLFLAVLLPIVLPELWMTGGWWCNMLVKLRAALSVQINTLKEDYATKVVQDVVWVWGGLYLLQTCRHYPSSIIHHPSQRLKSPKSTWWVSAEFLCSIWRDEFWLFTAFPVIYVRGAQTLAVRMFFQDEASFLLLLTFASLSIQPPLKQRSMAAHQEVSIVPIASVISHIQ